MNWLLLCHRPSAVDSFKSVPFNPPGGKPASASANAVAALDPSMFVDTVEEGGISISNRFGGVISVKDVPCMSRGELL